jgi:hypothetical protein
MSLRTLTLLILLFLLPLPQLHAQNSSRSARLDEPPPNAVLVQLNTGTRRINTLRQKGQIEKAEALQLVIQSIRETMADDFKDNFRFCPFYFFYDTAISGIVKRQFAGNLYDASFQLLTEQPAVLQDTNYFILQWGKASTAEEWNFHTLVASDWRGDQLKSPLPQTPDREYHSLNLASAKSYYVRSKRFDEQYKARAGAYSATLRRFYWRHFKKKRSR